MNPSSTAARPALPAGVWALGFVSLLMDISSEMVHSLLPLFLVGTLGVSVLAVGVIEGIAESTALIVKVFSGALSDWLGRRKGLALLGYAMGALSKPLFALATGAGTVVTARFIDRVGKGIRGAPRDALVGDLAPPAIRGACFGLRQSMDTIGAVLGPLAAIALMWAFADNIRTVLWFAAVPGIIAVLLLLKVPEPADHEQRPARLPISREGLARLGSPFWRLTALGTLVALARFSEAFLVLRASERGVPVMWVPLVLVVMSTVYTLTAYPAGHLSDRLPRHWVLGIGMAVLAAADVALALADNHGLLFSGVALWGLHMGLTQGILASLITDTAPATYRGTAFGVFNLLSGVALLVASAAAGWLWDRYTPASAFWAGAALATVATLAIPLLGRPARPATSPARR